MHTTFRVLRFLIPAFITGTCFGQTTPIDQVSPGPHLFFEAGDFIVNNNPQGPSLTFSIYMSASQTYVDYLTANGPLYGMQGVDVNYDLDFGTDGTDGSADPGIPVVSNSGFITSGQIGTLQCQLGMQGQSQGSFDTRFKYTFTRLPNNELLSTTPTHVCTVTVTWGPGVVIGTSANGAKIQLRCAATGYNTGPSGSKWGSLLGHSANTVGSAARIQTLPVKLSKFEIAKEGNSTNLTWSTTEETNSDHFDVQRSTDGKQWTTIQTVAAAGESVAEHHYFAVDEDPLNGDNLYRLHMIDRDGSSAYSKIQSVRFDIKSDFTMFPNPLSDQLSIKTAEDWSKVEKIQIYNMQGKEVYKSGGKPARDIDLKHLAGGMYVVKVTQKNNTSSDHKIVIAK
jgi:hypothetical protein